MRIHRIFRLAFVVAALAAPSRAADPGGPVSVGVAMLQAQPGAEAQPKPAVALVQAPAAAHEGGGFLDVGQMFNDAAAPYVNALVQALIAALISWVCLKIKQRTGVEIDQGHRDAITEGAQRAAGSLLADGEVKMNGLKVNVGNEALAREATALAGKIPDALAHFGITPQVAAGLLAQRIIDAIPQTTAGAAMVAQAHAAGQPQGTGA